MENLVPSVSGVPQVRATEAGMTLLEIVMTLLIVFMSVLVMSVSNLSIQGQSTMNQDRATVNDHMEALLEQLGATPVTGIGDLFPHEQEIEAFNDREVRGLRIKMIYADGNSTTRPLRYQLVANWLGAVGRPSKIVIHGIRAR
ncbi:MAG: hypothetical protein ACI97A_002593 [Planctomycetota bacterium]|jgi:hypothetical protein